MAALLIAAGIMIADKVDKKKQARKDKKALDEQRYRELQAETKAYKARRDSVKSDTATDSEDEGQSSRGTMRRAPPSYEEAVGSRRRQ
jgi:hypothetical protein